MNYVRVGLDEVALCADVLHLIVFGDVLQVLDVVDVGVARDHAWVHEACEQEAEVF